MKTDYSKHSKQVRKELNDYRIAKRKKEDAILLEKVEKKIVVAKKNG